MGITGINKKYSTPFSPRLAVVSDGAWVPRERSGKRVHVYTEDCFRQQVYIFVYNILAEVDLHHRMPAETKGEWTRRRVLIRLFKYFSPLKFHSSDVFNLRFLIIYFFRFFGSSMFIIMKAEKKPSRYIKTMLEKKKKDSQMKFLTSTTSICDLLWNERAATRTPTRSPSEWISNMCHNPCLFLSLLK